MTDTDLLALARRARDVAESVAAGDVPAMPAEVVERLLLAACADIERLALDCIGLAAERSRHDAEVTSLKEQLVNVYAVATSYADQLGLPHPGVRH